MTDDKPEMPATLPLEEEAQENVRLNSPDAKEGHEQEGAFTNRDPNNMNSDVKIAFEDIIGEPDPSLHSFDRVWSLSNSLFSCSKTWCYRIPTLILALPLSLIWGCWFAWLAILRVWCCVPCIRSFKLEVDCCHQIYRVCLSAFIVPCFEAISKIFYNFRVTLTKGEVMV